MIYVLFGGALFVGLALDKPLLEILFDGALHVTEEGWRKLTWRWAFFFLALAVLNEIVWRTQTTDFWVRFKMFGVVPLTFLFGALQYPLIMKYQQGQAGLARRRRLCSHRRLAQITTPIGEKEFFEIGVGQSRHRQERHEGEVGDDQRDEEVVGAAGAVPEDVAQHHCRKEVQKIDRVRPLADLGQ